VTRLAWLAPVLACAGGCSDDGQTYMPLSLHSRWSYLVDDGVNKMPDHIRVTRRIPVGGAPGYELAGELGVSQFAWQNGRLISSELSNTRFIPPLPILAPRERRVHWRGWVLSGDKKEPAVADVDFVKLKKDEGTGDSIDSTVSMKINQRHLNLMTRFRADFGIVRQEQQTGGQRDLSLVALTTS
jgi:hypothetical protein